MAAGYQPGDFFSLNLSTAALSPNPLGPPAQFEQVPIEANTAPDAKTVPAVKVERSEPVHVHRLRRVAHVKPRIRHTKLARRHGNPLDAEAFDTRIQVWPCKSGGICNWRRPH
jgi:hypothetical protein